MIYSGCGPMKRLVVHAHLGLANPGTTMGDDGVHISTKGAQRKCKRHWQGYTEYTIDRPGTQINKQRQGK
jgi:hypothetical protein